jgi:phosphoenolpyruvate carboxykinase (GTP)
MLGASTTPGGEGQVWWRGRPEDSDRNAGVPVSAILFGGRRTGVLPLVYEARGWQHGVYVEATMASEALVWGEGSVPLSDPMAMRDFCGYNMGDYFSHWLAVGEQLRHPPRVFHANWFRTGHDNRLFWPGFGENTRILRGIFERIEGSTTCRKTPIGWVPQVSSLDLSGFKLTADQLDQLLSVDSGAWMQEAGRSLEFLARFAGRLPVSFLTEHRSLVRRLSHSIH